MRAGVEAVPADPGLRPRPADGGYLPHVDGLRAVSIVAVIAFHAGTPGFAGGFVGVDIFFVISGFLIINQIVAALDAGRFSILDFYARRALRILPGYFLVLAASVVAGIVLIRSPGDLSTFAVSAALAPLFLTNIYFYAKRGYFDTGASQKPLLHTWSLSVEEQFYLVVPLLLVGLFVLMHRVRWRRGPVLGLAALAIGVASLVGCILATPPASELATPARNGAFFLTQWRAWEFVAGGAIGAVTAIGWTRVFGGLAPVAASIAGLAGLLMIALSISFHGLALLGVEPGGADGLAGFPGYAAVLPVLGAALVILGGIVAPGSIVARLLSLAPVVFIGQISYALYLWHWPLLAFGEMLPLDLAPGLVETVAIALSVALAMLTRHLVELPILAWRRRSGLGNDPGLALRLFAGSVVGAIGLALATGAVTGIAYSRAGQNPMLQAERAAEVSGSGICRSADPSDIATCFDGTKPVGMLVGDSHAFAILPRLEFEAERAGDRLLSLAAPGCTPQFVILDPSLGDSDPYCRDFAAALARDLPAFAGKAPFAILAGRWNAVMPRLGADAEAKFRESFEGLVDRLSDGGRRRLLILGPLPEFAKENPFNCVALCEAIHLPADRCGVSRASADARRGPTVALIRSVLSGRPNIRFVDPIDLFCDERICLPARDGALAFFDDHHLNAYGGKLLYERFEPDFLWAFRGGATPGG